LDKQTARRAVSRARPTAGSTRAIKDTDHGDHDEQFDQGEGAAAVT
jgi:hypothetical protein